MLPTRRALAAWISAKDTPRPKRSTDGDARVESDLADGYVLLVRPGAPLDEGRVLAWSAADADRAKPLPAGTWELRRAVVSKDGWNAWAAGSGQRLELKAGATAKLGIAATLRLEGGAELRQGKACLRGGFTLAGLAATIARGSGRIPVKVEIDGTPRGEAGYG